MTTRFYIMENNIVPYPQLRLISVVSRHPDHTFLNRIKGKQMPVIKCAVYVRKSTEHGLEQEFNSLQNQEESCKAYIASQFPDTDIVYL